MDICNLIHPELPPLARPVTAPRLPKMQQAPPIALHSILAADTITGHVLTRHEHGELEWIPYLYLRWGCPTLRNKAWLDNAVQDLGSKATVIPQWMMTLPRRPITAYHKIIPMFYVPPMDNGTLHGCYARIIYRLWGKSKIGITTLEVLRQGGNMPELEAFVQAKEREIHRVRGNKVLLSQAIGANMVRHDLIPIPEQPRPVRRKLVIDVSPGKA